MTFAWSAMEVGELKLDETLPDEEELFLASSRFSLPTWTGGRERLR